jgi:single-strand DNA-binding protein
MNKVMLIGRVEGDPHFKLTAKGKRRLWFRVCCVSDAVDEAGQVREHKTWLSVVLWGARAEGLRSALRDGQWIAVDGRISHWKRDGEQPPRWETEIVARDLTLLDRRGPTSAFRPPKADTHAA